MKTHYPDIGHCRYRISAKAIIRDDEGRFALALKEMKVDGVMHTKWDIPGGGIEHGDSIEETLRKEIREEMGLEVTEISQKPCYFFLAESACGKVPLGLVFYEVAVKNFEIQPSSECLRLEFFTTQEALEDTLWPQTQSCIEEAAKIFGKF